MSSFGAGGAGGEDDKKAKPACMVCKEELEADHFGIICGNDHHICASCAPAFVHTVMEELPGSIPIKCSECAAPVVVATFERQLDESQRGNYLSAVAMLTPEPGWNVHSCPGCSKYFEMWATEHSGNFFHCRADAMVVKDPKDATKEVVVPACLKQSCAHCFALLTEVDASTRFSEASFAAEAAKSTSPMWHFECAELASFRKPFRDAATIGKGAKCPNAECGIVGRKDDACTHMRCPKCQVQFCYICERSVQDCDKFGGPGGSIYRHNDQWDRNPARCPMYLRQISDVDASWPEDDAECLEKISRIKTLSLLRAAHAALTSTADGAAMYQRLIGKYGETNVLEGFTLEVVLTEDLTVIKREE